MSSRRVVDNSFLAVLYRQYWTRDKWSQERFASSPPLPSIMRLMMSSLRQRPLSSLLPFTGEC